MERHDRTPAWSYLAGCGELSGKSYRSSVESGGHESGYLPGPRPLHAQRRALHGLQHGPESGSTARALIVGSESGRSRTDWESGSSYQPRRAELSGTEAVVSAPFHWR